MLQLKESFLSAEEAGEFLKNIKESGIFGKTYAKKRSSKLFGDEGIKYIIHFKERDSVRECAPWSSLPCLEDIKRKVEEFAGEKMTVCVIQYYPNGSVGIKPHRDKEMVKGTKICGVSLGATRVLRIGGDGDYNLHHGSIYIIPSSLNDRRSHSIVEEPSIKEERYSLTFRNYK